ncbi:MAG TPA: SDR family NAD(P)-dependent oxidoreductase [Hyphomicrobiaceae bacterium]|nr:SDR family NAD(P)-dependent oxidoreductase [Hyphomicrobiaceae bacterium]
MSAEAPGGAIATRPMVVITGASEGIGRAFARRYAADGRDLLLIARRPEPLARLAEELRGANSVRVETLAQDVTAPDAPAAVDAALAAAGAYCDLLINNAGIGLSGAFPELPLADVDRLVATDVAAPTRLMHHVLRDMRLRRRGGIINLASLGGFAPGPYQAAYYASRAYMLSLSEAVAAEIARDGVSITAVAPGPVRTGFHDKMRADNDLYRWFVPSLAPETVVQWAVTAHNLGFRVVVPGLLNNILALSLRLMPHRISAMIQGTLFYPRNR